MGRAEVLICQTCGTQYPSTDVPSICKVCSDIRSAVRTPEQIWTDAQKISAGGYKNVFKEKEPGIIAVGTAPIFASGNRALLIQTGKPRVCGPRASLYCITPSSCPSLDSRAMLSGSGNVLWDCITVLTAEAKAKIGELGGIKAMAVSHPHFYCAMADWAEAFDAPVYIHEAGREWVTDPSNRIQYWSGRPLPYLNSPSFIC